jgi:hypothetical protein
MKASQLIELLQAFPDSEVKLEIEAEESGYPYLYKFWPVYMSEQNLWKLVAKT